MNIATDHETARRRSSTMWGGLLMLGAIFLGRQIVIGGPMIRIIVALVVMGVLAVPAIERPRAAIFGLFVLLPFLGTLRHMFLASTGTVKLDPLLLVTSAVAFTVFISLILNHEMDFSGTPLSGIVFLLLVVGVLQVFNPGQAPTYSNSLLVGFTGIMINLIPIAFFFIARSIADPEMTHKVVRLVLVVGAIACAYGLFQVFFGFRAFEKTWLATQGYNALQVGQTTRPFSIFNNAAEYAAYAHYAFVAAFATLLFAPRTKRTLMLIAVTLVAYSGFLIGSRGFSVKVGLAVIVLLAARARNRLLAAGVVIACVGAFVFWSATTSSTQTIQSQKAGASQLIEQQVRALVDPFNKEKSTLPIHFEAATTGILYAVTHQPFGLGTGVATTAGSKFGGLQAGTELDIGDSFLSLGIAGGLLYLAAIAVALFELSRVRRALPGPVWIGIWVMALTSVGAWLNGGLYAITPLVWFLIGAADGEYKKLKSRHLLTMERDLAATLPA
jgi:hypothetical protein